jgi:hypothetical protein
MADFTELDAQEEALFRLYRRHQSLQVRFMLNKLAAQSTIRLADAVGSRLNPEVRNHSQVLSHLAWQKSEAYASLIHSAGAIRFSTSFVRRALRGLGLEEKR